ncbi:hypothetical protein CMI37_28940 [Candidatus Pacearchaeota archaeon]|nr:hypothetical protein [Candidatus Pacearchaeota archaeon]
MIVKEQISSALTHPRKAFVLSQPGPWLRGNMKAETPIEPWWLLMQRSMWQCILRPIMSFTVDISMSLRRVTRDV